MSEGIYRETITLTAEARYVHKKVIGGAGEFALVILRLEPLPLGSGIEFVNDAGHTIRSEFIASIEGAIRQAAESKGAYGYPVVDFRATILGGAYHEVDSNERTFAISAENAFLRAVREGAPIILEKIMSLVVEVPDERLGSVIGDLSARRSHIEDVKSGEGTMEIRASVPASKLEGYGGVLLGITNGRGKFTMSFHHWARCPDVDPDPTFPGAMGTRIA